jgi:hypothetical protein
MITTFVLNKDLHGEYSIGGRPALCASFVRSILGDCPERLNVCLAPRRGLWNRKGWTVVRRRALKTSMLCQTVRLGNFAQSVEALYPAAQEALNRVGLKKKFWFKLEPGVGYGTPQPL